MIPGRQYTPADIWALIVRFRWLIVLPWIAVAGAVILFAQTLPDRYRSESVIQVVPQRVSQALVKSTLTAGIEERLPVITQQILSRTKLERIIQDFGLYKEEKDDGELTEDIIARMRLDIGVAPVKGDAFKVSYVSRDPRTAMRVTEKLASLFIEENLRDREASAEGANQFLESQLDEARRRLLDHEKKLEDYKRLYSSELPSQLSANVQSQAGVQAQLQQTQDAIIRDRDLRLQYERSIQELEVDASLAQQQQQLSQSNDPVAAAAQPAAVQLQRLRTAYAQAQLVFTADHPEMKRLVRQIRDMESKADEEALATPLSGGPVANPQEVVRLRRVQDLRAKIESIDRQVAAREENAKKLLRSGGEIERRLDAAPTRESEMVALNRDYNTFGMMYTELLRKSEEAKVSANLERRQIGEQFKMIDAARVPERPFSPNRQQFYLGGVFGGLALGVGLVALLEFKDSSLRTDHDVVTALSLPVLATIPAIITLEDRRHLRRRRMIFMGASAAAGCLAGVGLVAWRFNLLQRLF